MNNGGDIQEITMTNKGNNDDDVQPIDSNSIFEFLYDFIKYNNK